MAGYCWRHKAITEGDHKVCIPCAQVGRITHHTPGPGLPPDGAIVGMPASEPSRVRVVFRTFKPRKDSGDGYDPGGDVIALMPDQDADHAGNIMSYQHIGQHGGADYNHVIDISRPSTDEEIAPLARELASIGYLVEPITRSNKRARGKR